VKAIDVSTRLAVLRAWQCGWFSVRTVPLTPAEMLAIKNRANWERFRRLGGRTGRRD
jgi:hypothetical protein